MCLAFTGQKCGTTILERLASLGVKAAWLVPGLCPRLTSEAGGDGCGCRDRLSGRCRREQGEKVAEPGGGLVKEAGR